MLQATRSGSSSIPDSARPPPTISHEASYGSLVSAGTPSHGIHLTPPSLDYPDSEPPPFRSSHSDITSATRSLSPKHHHRHPHRSTECQPVQDHLSESDKPSQDKSEEEDEQQSRHSRQLGHPISCFAERSQCAFHANCGESKIPNWTWPLPAPVENDGMSQFQNDQKVLAALKRRVSLPCKAPPTRAMIKTSESEHSGLQVDENWRTDANHLNPRQGPLFFGHADNDEDLDHPFRHGPRIHARLDTPAMITLRRASTRRGEVKVTLISKTSETNGASSESATAATSDSTTRATRGSIVRFATPLGNGNFGESIKSEVAEPATTIAEFHIEQQSIAQEAAPDKPQLMHMKSGSVKIVSRNSLHEVIWEDVTSASGSSSRHTCESDPGRRGSIALRPSGTGVDVRRFSLPDTAIKVIDHLKDVKGQSSGPPHDSLVHRPLSLPAGGLEPSRLQKILSWAFGAHQATGQHSQTQCGMGRTRSATSASFTLFGFRPREPPRLAKFETQLEDNGYTASIDRVEFFPPLDSRRSSICWRTPQLSIVDTDQGLRRPPPSGEANSTAAFGLDASPSPSSTRPLISGDISPTMQDPDSFERPLELSAPRNSGNLLMSHGQLELGAIREKASAEPRRKSTAGQAIGASSHTRRKSVDSNLQLARIEPNVRAKGRLSNGLLSTAGSAGSKNGPLAGASELFPRRQSKYSDERSFGGRSKSCDFTPARDSVLDVLMPSRYAHQQLKERRRSAFAGRNATFPIDKPSGKGGKT